MDDAAQPRPNVIWVFGDQLRAQAVGYMGDPNVATPNIDRLAAEGVTFTAAVAGTPLCAPCRGSLLASRYPHECVPGHEYPLPDGQQTVASVFRAAGYQTAYFGKWHLDGFKERDGRAAMHVVPPHRRGDFQHWAAYENNNSQWDCWVHGGEDETAFRYRLPGYETDALTDLLLGYLRERSRDRAPFFAVLSMQPPHDPYVAPAEWMQRHTPGAVQLRANVPAIPRIVERARRDLAGAYAMIENLDWNLGRIRTVLDEEDLWRQTHIVFFSDHGDLHGSHGLFRKTAPWEEAIRIPFVIGGGVRYERKSGSFPIPLNHVDVAPTTLGLCGIAPPDWMCGHDYSGYRLRDRPVTDEPDSAYLQIVVPTLHLDSVDRPWRGVVTRDGWKYVALEGQPWLLFNLNEDPYEQANLALDRRYARERTRLQERLAQWISDTGDAFPLPG
jgi:arylsulfatase A-like enzyme